VVNGGCDTETQLLDDGEGCTVVASNTSPRGNGGGQSHSSGSKDEEDGGETHYGCSLGVGFRKLWAERLEMRSPSENSRDPKRAGTKGGRIGTKAGEQRTPEYGWEGRWRWPVKMFGHKLCGPCEECSDEDRPPTEHGNLFGQALNILKNRQKSRKNPCEVTRFVFRCWIYEKVVKTRCTGL
jgi:hypothetical protein